MQRAVLKKLWPTSSGGACVYVVLIPAGLGGVDGKFTIAHGAAALPISVDFMMEAGEFWFQPTYCDDVNLFLVASDPLAKGRAIVTVGVPCGGLVTPATPPTDPPTVGPVPAITIAADATHFEALWGFFENGGGQPSFVSPKIAGLGTTGYHAVTAEIVTQASVKIYANQPTGPSSCVSGPGWPNGGSTELAWVVSPSPLSTSNPGTVVSGPKTVVGTATVGSSISFDPFVVPAGNYVALRARNISECNNCTSPTGYCDQWIEGCMFENLTYKWQKA